MPDEQNISQLKEEILRLKKEAQDAKWDLQKTNESFKALYEELEKRNRELKKFAEAKSEFVSVVSHELRTPLTTIREGISQVLDGILGKINDEQQEFLSISLSDIDRLKRTVDNLLDISRLETEKAKINRSLVDIIDLVKKVKASFTPQVKELNLDIKLDFSEGKTELYIDKDKIIQVFTNLIGNAIRFTQKGGIAISINDRGKHLECRVQDTGVGIDKENLQMVFGKFQQFGKPVQGEEGVGLGLSICKAIVELHGGHIKVESEVGQGTSFVFTLPKLSVDEIFYERIHYSVKDAIRQKSVFSVVVFNIANTQEVMDNMDRAKLALLIDDLQRIAISNLRRKADLALESKNAILMILTATEKKDAMLLTARIHENFLHYLGKEKLEELVKISYQIISFPEDGLNEQELLEKAGLWKELYESKETRGESDRARESISFLAGDQDPELLAAVEQSEKDAKDMFMRELVKKDRRIKDLQNELESKRDELKKLDQLKSDFITTISHELRTPMTIIQEGVSQVLEGVHGSINDDQKDYLTMSFEGISRLAHIVNELLDISNLEAEKAVIQRELVNIAEVIQECAQKFTQLFRDKGIVLRTNFSDEQIFVFIDEAKIREVLSRILDNALKFTEKGRVIISAKIEDGFLKCDIIDTGRGISEENISKVFEKFKQFDRPYGPGEKGTGLGLSICREIIELHGGEIRVESKLEKGTKFSFVIPQLSVNEVFQEYVTNGIKEAIRYRESLSVIVFKIKDFQKTEQRLGKEKTQQVLENLNTISKRCLRRKADLSLKSDDAVLLLLPLTTKENVFFVADRIKKQMEEHLSAHALEKTVQLQVGMASFPEDGSSHKELLHKAGRF